MKTVGIICEYNPFHLGHLRQLHLIREMMGENTAIIGVMSGNYVQRGLPAAWDKFTRANAAVACGVDLILELPITKVLQSAEGFARGGVEVLTRLNAVDILCFGAECGDTAALMTLAEKMDSAESREQLRSKLDEGLPYAAARQLAVGDQDDLLSSPNNILGVEYCRAIKHLNSNLQPLAVQRNGNYHAETADEKEPSATAVRTLFPHGNWEDFVPPAATDFLNGTWYDLPFGERAILARLRALDAEDWMRCAHGSEGLWSKAMKAARTKATMEEIIEETKSKRYPRTRIQRLLLCAYLGITEDLLHKDISYVRILAASDTGRKLLRTMKGNSNITLINPGEPPIDLDYYALETRASDLFTLFSSGAFPCHMEQNARLQV